jgi:hypothetical protein
MKRKSAALLALVIVAACTWFARVAAQTAGPPAGLRQQIEQRFDVLPVQDGLVLRPKTPIRDVRWVEVADGVIRVDGAPLSGAELRTRLGDSASLVMQLSYLDPAARTTLFGAAGATPSAQTPPAAPSTEAPPAAPAPPTAPTSPTPPTPPTNRRETSGQFKMGGNITVPVDERVTDDVVVVGGSIDVFGEVRGNVVAVGGSVELGPESSVGGDVTVIGGTLRRDPKARVTGSVHEIGAGGDAATGVRLPRNRARGFPGFFGGRNTGLALLATLTRVTVLCLLAALVILLGRGYVDLIGSRAAAEPMKAGAIGFLSQLLVIPVTIVTIVLLVITIIGIPLLVLVPFALLGLVVVALVGFTSVAHYVGSLMNTRFGWEGRGPYATTIAGILVLVSPMVLARIVGLGGMLFPISVVLIVIGAIVEYLAWTIGFGAVAIARFSRFSRQAPPPA